MLTRQFIEAQARKLGAAKFGVGDLKLFENEDIRRDPKMICPAAKCIIGFGIPVPRGLYRAMEDKAQYYTYTQLGVKALDEEYYEVFLFKMAALIEDEGYDACLQRTTPNLRVKGDKSTNPEVIDTYELQFASPVEPGKPAPDIMIDFGKAAKACGIDCARRHCNRQHRLFESRRHQGYDLHRLLSLRDRHRRSNRGNVFWFRAPGSWRLRRAYAAT